LGNCKEEGLGASVVAGSDAALVLQPAEHDLDPAAPFVVALVRTDGMPSQLPARDAGACPLVFQRIPEPVGIVATVGDLPFSGRQAAQQGCRADVVADLANGHEEAQGDGPWHR
jgi:hypothetical protein